MSTLKKIEQVDFYFDIKCPFAHMASTRIHELEAICPVAIIWKPVLLAGLLQFSKAPQGKNPPTHSTIMSQTKRLYWTREILMQNDQLKVKQIFPKNFPAGFGSLHVMRLLTSIKDNNKRKKCAIDCYNTLWNKGMDTQDRNILSQIATKYDININIIDNPSIKKELYNNTKSAVENFGLIGVPSIVINNNKNYMFYGVDRFPFIKQILLYKQILHPPMERMLSNIKPIEKNNIIEFYFDYTSPYAYLAYKRLNELKAFADKIILRPICLKQLMKTINSPHPFETYGKLKIKIILKDMQRWFKATGLVYNRNALRMVCDTMLAMKVCLLDQRTIGCIFDARWRQGIDIGDKNKLMSVLNDSGFDGKMLVDYGMKDENVMKKLEGNTKFAADKGIFGVPSFVINYDYKRYIWGQDRMCWVKDVCCGWKAPTLGSDVKAKL